MGIRYNVIKVYPLFRGQSQKGSKFSDLKTFDLRTPFSVHSESKDVHLCFIMSPGKMIFAVFRAMTVAPYSEF